MVKPGRDFRDFVQIRCTDGNNGHQDGSGPEGGALVQRNAGHLPNKTKKPPRKAAFRNLVGYRLDQTRRSTIIFLISAIALAGFRPFGQAWEQFMMVWQR